MQLRAALQAALKNLLRHHVPSAQLAAELLLMHVLDRDRSYIYSHPESELPPETEERYLRIVAERAAGKPTQYITGQQEFWGMDFEVTPDVLIPRPETEQVVEMVLELSKRQGFDKNARLRLVDVGAGSGCIALALASEFSRAVIFSTDISRRALVVASRNAVRLGMPERVKFLESDLLDRLLDADFLGTFDFVVSNPPYVGREEVDSVQREVREHEPLLAWGGLERGDEIYARLFPQAARALKPGGYVVVEIGYNMRDRILALLGVGAAVSPAGSRTEALYRPVQGEGPEPADRQSQGGAEESVARTAAGWSDIEVHPDLAGIPRVVIAKRRP